MPGAPKEAATRRRRGACQAGGGGSAPAGRTAAARSRSDGARPPVANRGKLPNPPAPVSPARRHASVLTPTTTRLRSALIRSGFTWLTAAMKESHLPGVIGSPVLLAAEVSDATPQHWTFHSTDHSLEVEAGEPASWDVRYTGTVRSWRGSGTESRARTSSSQRAWPQLTIRTACFPHFWPRSLAGTAPTCARSRRYARLVPIRLALLAARGNGRSARSAASSRSGRCPGTGGLLIACPMLRSARSPCS